METHTKRKNHWCLDCNSRFGRERDLIKHRSSKKHKTRINARAGSSIGAKASSTISDVTANDQALSIGTSMRYEEPSQAISHSKQRVESLGQRTGTNTRGRGPRPRSKKGAVQTRGNAASTTPKLRKNKRTFSDINSTEGGDGHGSDVASFCGPINQTPYFLMNSEPTSNPFYSSTSASHINIQPCEDPRFTPGSTLSLSHFPQDPVENSHLGWVAFNLHTPNTEVLDEYINYSPAQAHQTLQASGSQYWQVEPAINPVATTYQHIEDPSMLDFPYCESEDGQG